MTTCSTQSEAEKRLVIACYTCYTVGPAAIVNALLATL